MQIHRSGTHSYIKNSSNTLVFNSDAISLTNYAGNSNRIVTAASGEVKLYYSDSVKLETTNTGAVVTGICTATSFSGSGEGLTRTTQLSHRNKARNGELKISQRATTFSPTTSNIYLMDGWMTQHGSAGNLDCTVTQSTDAPAGFSKSLKITPDSTVTPSGSQNGMLAQRLEGQDFQDLAFGTSDAKPITVSWYAKTSATGAGNYTVKVEYNNGTNNYAVNKLFAFTTTWTRYTYTIPATGTATSVGIRDDRDLGFRIEYNLFSGPDDVASQFTQWTLNPVPTYKVISGQKNFMDNTNNELYITGLQIEVGSVATPFEHRSIGDELARCQRYCVVIGADQEMHLGTAHAYNSTNINLSMHLPVAIRLKPTASVVLATSGGDANKWLQAYMGATGVKSNASISVSDCSEGHAQMRLYLQNAHSGLSVGQALWCHTLPDAKLILDAEL